jgi:prepilin peptidase CpaA
MHPLAWITFAGLVAWAAVRDIRTYRVPNWIPLLLALAVVMFPPPTVEAALDRAAALVIVAGLAGALWWRGMIGGGDFKLLLACSIWIGISGFPQFLLGFGVASFVQGLATLVAAHAGARQAPLASALRARVPLAVSIAAGALYWSLWQTPPSLPL